MICQYCGKECKNNNSLVQHEIRCKFNPNHIQCLGNKGNMPTHLSSYYKNFIYSRNGDKLDITREQLDIYKETHKCCEICGKTIDEAVKWKSQYAPKNLCIDHNHKTLKFRGLLCSTCNRQLGWYEKYKTQIEQYLNK